MSRRAPGGTTRKEDNSDARRSMISGRETLSVPRGVPKDVRKIMQEVLDTNSHFEACQLPLIQRLAETRILYRQIQEVISKEGLQVSMANGEMKAHPLLMPRGKLASELNSLERFLGLSVTSRAENLKAGDRKPNVVTPDNKKNNPHRMHIVS